MLTKRALVSNTLDTAGRLALRQPMVTIAGPLIPDRKDPGLHGCVAGLGR
jgi:hypothetical protein